MSLGSRMYLYAHTHTHTCVSVCVFSAYIAPIFLLAVYKCACVCVCVCELWLFASTSCAFSLFISHFPNCLTLPTHPPPFTQKFSISTDSIFTFFLALMLISARVGSNSLPTPFKKGNYKYQNSCVVVCVCVCNVQIYSWIDRYIDIAFLNTQIAPIQLSISCCLFSSSCLPPVFLSLFHKYYIESHTA